jgi:long-chain acyl-CoA synthetase
VEDFDPWRHLLDTVEDDDQEIAGALAPRPVLTALSFVVAKLLYALAWLLLGLRVSGRENLPQDGPFLISPNHQSFLDAFLLVGTLPFRVFAKVFYVGASEYFATPLSPWFARSIRVIPVDPDSNLVRAMRAGAYGLRKEMILVLFPEGERSIDAELKTFKKGAAILSLNVDAPIVPVALDGLFDIWPRARRPRLWKLLPFSGAGVRVRFGKPLVPAGGKLRTERDYGVLTEQLRLSVSGLLSR